MDNFISNIRKKYKRRKFLKREEEPWPKKRVREESLISLQLVQSEEIEGSDKRKLLCGSDKKPNKNSSSKTIRSPISQEDLFIVEEGKEPVRKLIVEGGAGAGKTTLCTMLAENWAENKIFSPQFNCVLLLPLRERSVSTATTLPQLFELFHSCEKTCISVIEELKNCDGEGVLIIADGWDELNDSNRTYDSFLYKLLFGDILSEASLLLTSRPSASFDLHTRVDRLVEVVGFTEDNVKQYIESEFKQSPEEGSSLIRQLENIPAIRSVCSIPLNCSIICHLWRMEDRNQILPATLTKLYSEMILNVVFRNVIKTPFIKCPKKFSSFDAIPKDLQSIFWLTCKFAFKCLAEDQIVFQEDQIKMLVNEPDSNFLCLGLLQPAQSLVICGLSLTFNFLHLTFQEYLAALHLATLPNEKKLEIFNALGRKDRFVMVWRFLFGLCSRKTECIYSKKIVLFDCETVHRFVSAIVKEKRSYRDDSLTYECKNTMLLYHCALESEDTYVSTYFAAMLDGQFDDSYENLYDCEAVLNILRHTAFCQEVVIDFSRCTVGDAQVFGLTDILSNGAGRLQVSKLSLDHNKISDQGFIDLFCRAPESFTLLSELSIEDNQVCNVMSPFLDTHCKTLTDLTLADNLLGSTGLQSLQTAVDEGYLHSLTDLNLSNTFTNDADINGALLITLLTSIAHHCPKVDCIYLSKNNFGVPGAGALGEGLRLLANTDARYTILKLKEVNFNCEAMMVFSSRFLSSDTPLVNNSTSAKYSCDLNLDENPLGSCGLLELLKIYKTSACKVTDLQLDKICTPDVVCTKCHHNSEPMLDSSVLGSSLTSLYLRKNGFDGDMCISMLCLAIPTGVLNNLEHLNLSNTFTQDAVTNGKLLATLLPLIVSHCGQLDTLDLSDNDLNVPGALAIGESFPGLICNCKLSHLKLSKTCLTGKALAKFSKCLTDVSTGLPNERNIASCEDLTLDLDDNPLGLSGLTAVINILKSDIYPITTLHLRDTTSAADVSMDSSDEYIEPQTICLATNTENRKLTSLYLSRNNFYGNADHILSTILRLCQSLEDLSCLQCSLTSKDIVNTLRKLKSFECTCSKLKDLDLEKNSIEDHAIKEIIQCLPKLFPCLEELDIDGNLVSSEVKASLKAKLKVSLLHFMLLISFVYFAWPTFKFFMALR